MPELQVISDGTKEGTKIFIDGEEQTDIENIIFSADIESALFHCIIYRSTDDIKRAKREVIFK